MPSLLRLAPGGAGLIIVIALGLAACGQAATPGGATAIQSSAAASANSDTAAPSAAKQLAPFFTAAQLADSDLHRAADLVNGDISGTSMRFTPATLAAIRVLDNAPVARAIPAGLPTGLLRDVLVVYADLASRTAAFNAVGMFGSSGRALPTGSPESREILRGLRNGAPAAARFGSDLAASRALAHQTPVMTIAAPDARAAAELALRIRSINLRNSCSQTFGGWVPTELEPVIWQPSTTQHPNHYDGTIGGGRFGATYTPQNGWQITIYAC